MIFKYEIKLPRTITHKQDPSDIFLTVYQKKGRWISFYSDEIKIGRFYGDLKSNYIDGLKDIFKNHNFDVIEYEGEN